ncbi:hypothetical protein Tco_0634592 [Tanacetum coccineum]
MDDFCREKVTLCLPTTFWAEAVSLLDSMNNPFWCHVTILNTLDNLGKFDGKGDEGKKEFLSRSTSSQKDQDCIVMPIWLRILHILGDDDAQRLCLRCSNTRYMIGYKIEILMLLKCLIDNCLKNNVTVWIIEVILPAQNVNTGSRDVSTAVPEVNTATPEDLGHILLVHKSIWMHYLWIYKKELCDVFEKLMKDISFNELYVTNFLVFGFTDVNAESTPTGLEMTLVQDGVMLMLTEHLYSSMIRIFDVPYRSKPVSCCSKPTLGLWYSKDSPLELVAYTDNDYVGATQDRKSTTRGSAGFHQVIDFLNRSHIYYALTKNPAVSVSFIKQFWRSAEPSTDDNGEVKINTAIDDKLTFQKGAFSPQWRFLIHNILHCLSPKKTAWEQFSSNIATAGRKLSDAEVQEKASTETEPIIQEVTPTEVIQDQESSEKGSAEVSTAGATKGTASEVPVVSTAEENILKKSKKEIEQERLSFAEAIRLEEQMNEEQRAQIAGMKKLLDSGMKRKGKELFSQSKEEYGSILKNQGKLTRLTKRKKSLPRKRRIVKRQKLEEDAEKEELKGFLDIITRMDVIAEDVGIFSTKFKLRRVKRIFSQNLNNLEEQLTKEKLHENDSKTALITLMKPSQRFFHSEWPMHTTDKSRDDFRKYTRMYTRIFKEIMIRDIAAIENSRTELENSSSEITFSSLGNENKSSDNESRSSGNDADADIRPSYDSDTVSEVNHDIFENVFAHGIQTYEQPKSIPDTYVVNENNSVRNTKSIGHFHNIVRWARSIVFGT